jgi:hypothetical protein
MAINPLQQPINYAVDVQSPFEAAIGGIKLGAGLEELNVARQKRAMELQQQQATQAQQAQFQSGLNRFFTKPASERTFDELQPLLIGANKQQFDALKLVGEQMGTEKLNSSKKFTSQVLLAFEANPETAKTLLRERIEAEPDPGQKRAFQDILSIADQDPSRASRLVESLGAGTFGPEWYKGIEDYRKARREAEMQPAALKKAQADAEAAVAEAERKLLEAKDTPSRLAAEQALRIAQETKERALTAASLGVEARAVEQAPVALRELRAKADKAVADSIAAQNQANTSEEKAAADLARAKAEAEKAKVEARFAEPLAQADLNKRRVETLAPSVREAIDFKNLSPADQAVFQNLQILKKPPAPVTNVNVSNVDKTAAGELGKLVPDLYTQMNAASDLTGELARYRTALGTAITGPFADRRLQVAQVANAFGLIGDKGINATRELIQGNAEMSLKARSLIAGQGQGPITEGEQKLLVKARAGDINFTKGELNTLFNIFDRAAKAQYDQSRKLLQSATTQSPTAQIFLDAAKPFDAQTAPPVQPAASQQAAPQPAQAPPVMPSGFRVIQRGQ